MTPKTKGAFYLLSAPLILFSACGGSESVKESAAPPIEYKFGEPFQTKKFEFNISKIRTRRRVGSEFFASAASKGAVYVILKYEYKNISDKPIGMFSQPGFKLFDSLDAEYSSDISASSSFASETDNDEKVFSDLNPGISVRGSDVFEVSKELFDKGGWKLVINADKKITLPIN